MVDQEGHDFTINALASSLNPGSLTAFARLHATSAIFRAAHLVLGGLNEWKAPGR